MPQHVSNVWFIQPLLKGAEKHDLQRDCCCLTADSHVLHVRAQQSPNARKVVDSEFGTRVTRRGLSSP